MKTRRNLFLICLLGAGLLQALTNEAQPITKIATGQFHTLFLKADGSLWAMGFDEWGQLGDGYYHIMDPYGVNRPEHIESANVIALAAGGNHSLFIKSDGSLWSIGNNYYGQLGDGTTNPTNLPEMIVSSNVTAVAAGDNHSLFLKSDGSLWGMGLNNYGQLGDGSNANTNQPEQIMASDVKAISSGFN